MAIETAPPVPSLRGLFVLLCGGLLLPGLPVPLGDDTLLQLFNVLDLFSVFHLVSPAFRFRSAEGPYKRKVIQKVI